MLAEKMSTAEAAGRHRDKAIHRLERVTSSQPQHLININEHLEDLDNRGRRNNIRVRGIPESVEAEQITPDLTKGFQQPSRTGLRTQP